jgi:raffinose/stachyose/melibiose transport system substrate-binding protein
MRRTILILAIFLVPSLLFAGGQGEGASADSGPVTIRYWDSGELNTFGYQWHSENVELFNARNEDIQVEYTNTPNGDQYLNKLSTEMAANNVPDFFATWTAGRLEPFVRAGRVHGLNDIIENSEILSDNVNLGNASAATFDGVVYAIPNEVAGEVIYYNTAIFAEYDLEVPETWEDLVDVIEVLNENGVTPFALANKDPWPGTIPYMAIFDRVNGPDAYRPAVFEQEAVFNTEPFVKAGEYLYALVEMGAYPQNFNALDYAEGISMFDDGKAAMRYNGTWEMPGHIEALGDDVDAFTWPVMPEEASETGWPIVQNHAWAIGASSEHKDAAARFLEFVMSDERQAVLAEEGYMIAARNVPFDESKLHPMAAKIATELGSTPNPILIWDVMLGQNIGKELNLATQAILGGADIQQTLDSLNRIAEVEWD